MKYVSEHVLTALYTVENHKIKEVVEYLQTKYGRLSLEKLEELVSEWMKFGDDDYDKEDQQDTGVRRGSIAASEFFQQSSDINSIGF